MRTERDLRSPRSLNVTATQIEAWFAGITYKPGWTFAVEPGPKQTHLVIRTAADDSRGGAPLVVTHRFALPGNAVVGDRSSFVSWVRHVIGKVELHERDEWLLVDHRRV